MCRMVSCQKSHDFFEKKIWVHISRNYSSFHCHIFSDCVCFFVSFLCNTRSRTWICAVLTRRWNRRAEKRKRNAGKKQVLLTAWWIHIVITARVASGFGFLASGAIRVSNWRLISDRALELVLNPCRSFRLKWIWVLLLRWRLELSLHDFFSVGFVSQHIRTIIMCCRVTTRRHTKARTNRIIQSTAFSTSDEILRFINRKKRFLYSLQWAKGFIFAHWVIIAILKKSYG